MIKDIKFTEIENVFVAIVEDKADGVWKVYLLNRQEKELETVMVTSKGYGEKDGETQKTSMLRHMIPKIEAGEYALIEPISEDVFHLNNEYWVSFFIDAQLYDKKYIFVPETIIKEHLSFIPELNMEGVLHQ